MRQPRKQLQSVFTERFITLNGKELRWKHIIDLYYRNTGAVMSTAGLSFLPKLTYEHVMLTKMRVDLAAQVNTYDIGVKLCSNIN